jgi:hypothetical protein
MIDWEPIVAEGEKVARQLLRLQVDLSEAEKAGDYFIGHGYVEAEMAHYLRLLASNPPARSQRSKAHYEGIRDIWDGWRTTLHGADKARAWGWGVRLAKAGG